MKKLLLCLLLATTASGVLSQNEDHVQGHVFEFINKDSISPLPGVNVYYSGTNLGTITNADGFFKLEC